MPLACVEAFVHPTEDKDKVARAIALFTDIPPEETPAKTCFGLDMFILRSSTRKEDEIRGILQKLAGAGIEIPHEETRVMLNKQRAFMGEIVPGKGISITLKL